MEIFETKYLFSEAIQRLGRKTVGFVPTMGALHQGHISLVERCRLENDVAVASIFVNPTQFNDKHDFANYPRGLESDFELLTSVGCDFVFAPSIAEMYPEEDTRIFDFAPLDKVMEGINRPGHFNGVGQIVSKLFDVVQPDRAYFGEKDFQQLAIIKRLVAILNSPVEITGCPTVREADGLAMSSRNIRLTPKQRQNAPSIFSALLACKEKINDVPLDELKKWVIKRIDEIPEMQTEYFDIVDRNTLQTAAKYEKNALQACIAVRAGDIRLIDNVSL